MKIDKRKFKNFDSRTAAAWGKQYFGDWLVNIQNQENDPITPCEHFFRKYSQGIDYVFNRVLRFDQDIDKYCEDSSVLDAEMFYEAIDEINKQPLQEDIIVYRYINKRICQMMRKWSGIPFFMKGRTVFDKAFLSTTLSLNSVRDRPYVKEAKKMLKIYVPKGTPCVYIELIADMKEHEIIFAPNTKLLILSAPLFSKIVECVVV